MTGLTHGDVLRRIVARADIERFADRVLDSFWETPEFQRLRPPREEVRTWVRWNLNLVIRWLVDGVAPSEDELEVFREQARARAADGTPPDIVLANFRRGARFAWGALLDAAAEEERPALLASAETLFDYVDRVSSVFAEVYANAAGSSRVDAEEAAARALLRRLAADEPPLPEDLELAERVGLDLDRAAFPLVITVPGRSAQYHAELAGRLRRQGVLAASEGRRVICVSARPAGLSELKLEREAILAQGRRAVRDERGRVLDDLRIVADVAAERGARGKVEVGDHLAELLLRRSPRVATQIEERVYGPLNAELAKTLDLLVEHDFERGVTADALPVHRNTLRDRIRHISELTGVDLERSDGRGLAWLAWLTRRTR